MLILASASPRRQELLRLITTDFSVIVPNIEENIPLELAPEQLVQTLAKQKAKAVLSRYPAATVIGADTIVAQGQQIFGKPKDPAHATAMLKALSGTSHRVITGVSLLGKDYATAFAVSTTVQFYPLSAEEIAAYVQSGEPMDKAGAYGIQEKGSLFVKEICGDYFNIVGLPVAPLHRALQALANYKTDKKNAP